ncbi:MAG: carbon-nitrogen hydrolase family protein, partial [Planctomycetota bacterium]
GQILSKLHEAGRQSADLVIFPECALTGYCFESLEEARPLAQEIPGPATREIAVACRELGTHVVLGMLEEDGERVFNAAVCIGPDGVVAKYRKVHLPKLGVDHFVTPGDEKFAVHELESCRFGMLICYDASFPEASRCLAIGGADLIVLPTNWPPGAEPTAEHVINARSSENHIFFAAVNRIGLERGFQFIGRSRITDVHGNTLAAASADKEEIIYVEIDPKLARQKKVQRATGHSVDRMKDRRPEFYQDLSRVGPK